MDAKPSHGEETPMSDPGREENGHGEPGLDAVRRRLAEIQESKRGRVRWTVSRKTAEMAIVALDEPSPPRKKSAKPRRRKRHKRLL